MRWRARRPQPTGDSNGPGDGCPHDNEFDAFLSGRYVDWLLASGNWVPGWAWVNSLAHGTVEELLRLTAPNALHPSRDFSEWRRLIGGLADDLLALAPDDATLTSLQTRALVPLELHLAQQWWAQVMSPCDLAVLVTTALKPSADTDA